MKEYEKKIDWYTLLKQYAPIHTMGSAQSSQEGHIDIETSNQHLLRTITRSPVELPPFMVICRRPIDFLSGAPCLSVLVRTEKVARHQGTWRIFLVKQPHWLPNLHTCVCVLSEEDLWFQNQQHTILVQRQSRRLGSRDKLYATTITYKKYKIPFPPWDSIPVVDLSDANVILPSEFVQLNQDRYADYRFILHRQLTRPTHHPPQIQPPQTPPLPGPPPRPVVQQSQIPQHVVNGFLEGLLARGDSCPIGMEPLEKDTACLTPCGHTMSFDAAEHWIRDAHSCPVCRAPLELRHLQKWSAS